MTRKEIKKLDALWATVVKSKADWKCEHCGRYDSRMEAAHVVGRRHRATRWGCWFDTRYDLAGHCLCHVCHQEYDEHGPKEQEVVEKTIGVYRKAKLQERATKQVARYQDYEEIKEILEQEGAENDDSPYAQEQLPKAVNNRINDTLF